MRRRLLRFLQGNSKLDQSITTFSLPSGWTCPHAKICLAKADRRTGEISDGPDTEIRCYSASNETWRTVRNVRWHNYELLKKAETLPAMNHLILVSLPKYARYVRLHVGGDFFSQDYFDAWLSAAILRPDTVFYGYTKSLPYWVRRLGLIPENLVLTASLGGSRDPLAGRHGLRTALMVKYAWQAAELGLELDHDDSHAMRPGPDFALLVHGTQPEGSEAAAAVAEQRRNGNWGYGRRAAARRLSLL